MNLPKSSTVNICLHLTSALWDEVLWSYQILKGTCDPKEIKGSVQQEFYNLVTFKP